MTPSDLINGILDGTVDVGVTGGSLDGATLKSVARFGDLQNVISIGTAAAFVARDLMKESVPYYREYDDTGLVIRPTYHFIRELRRVLSGDADVSTSTFSPDEWVFYAEYQDWIEGTVKEGELLQALNALDKWLVDEVTNTPHTVLNRDYGIDHKWNKIGTRT